MQSRQHFGVVGAGVVGAGIAWHLAKRGHRVTLIEQGPVPNPSAASFDQHRLTRRIYAEQAEFAERGGGRRAISMSAGRRSRGASRRCAVPT